MKATGIVRRIDDLGRVVIPKEIRRTMRIHEGDPLEIFTDNDGSVIFKKYSPINELGQFASYYTEALNKTTGRPVLLSDRDYLVAGAGLSRKDVTQLRISPQLEPIFEMRKTYVYSEEEGGQRKIYPAEGIDQFVLAATPILANGGAVGVVMFLTDKPGDAPGETEVKLLQSASLVLSKQMEE